MFPVFVGRLKKTVESGRFFQHNFQIKKHARWVDFTADGLENCFRHMIWTWFIFCLKNLCLFVCSCLDLLQVPPPIFSHFGSSPPWNLGGTTSTSMPNVPMALEAPEPARVATGRGADGPDMKATTTKNPVEMEAETLGFVWKKSCSCGQLKRWWKVKGPTPEKKHVNSG